MKKIEIGKLPIFNWATGLEDGAILQARNMSILPFAFHHIALMPDAHQGYGMPIGGVLATEGVVIPNAVGVDIGCGMAFINTGIKKKDFKPYLPVIMGDVRENIPVGFHKYERKCDPGEMPDGYTYACAPPEIDRSMIPVVSSQFNNARYQLGTLGGGNHFIEFQIDQHDNVCVMIHSGSRNLGKQVADHYNTIAKKLNARWYTKVDAVSELAFLPLDTYEGQAYMAEMSYCVEYAKRSRSKMISRVCEIIESYGYNVAGQIHDVAHNYAAEERHFGRDVIVPRKGATRARAGELGIIPGSQGSSSYIVSGKGNRDSFMSCSHGAGRAMGRKQAQRELDVEKEKARLDNMGVLHAIRGVKDLDEAPSAYKDIDVVMENQADLVNIVQQLKPIGVIKG